MKENQSGHNGARRWLGYLLKYGVPLLVTVLLCKLLFQGVDTREMMHTIRTRCHFEWIALALVISVFSHVFRALRWNIQLVALGIRASMFSLIISIFGTYAVNLVLPRLGELWRSAWISKRQDAPFATVFGSMVAERLADTVTVALLTLVTFALATTRLHTYFGENMDAYNKIIGIITSPWLWGAVVLLALAAWKFFTWRTANPLVCKIQGFVRGLWQGFAVIATMPHKGLWLFYTLCLWGCYFTQLYVAFYAFDFTADIVGRFGIVAVMVTFVLSSISMGVPSNGGIGPWQWSVIMALGLYGLARQESSTFANLVMGSQTLMLIALGIFTFVSIAVMQHTAKRRVSSSPDKSRNNKETTKQQK